jgi:hypothetical protein
MHDLKALISREREREREMAKQKGKKALIISCIVL